jgi:uncharacterized membrane protein YagU involved in acid resistance
MNDLAAGAVAGFVGTAPMTVVMEGLRRLLPEHEQYPLPPREITEETAHKAGADGSLNEPLLKALTAAAHFGYGAAVGCGYGALARYLPGPTACKGMTYGLAVWAGSYLGLVPALGLLAPATEHPPRRTALMIAAHLVWGAATALLAERLADESPELDGE